MDAFTLIGGDSHALPAVVSIPHSGTWLPDDIRASMRPDAVLASTDWYLPELYGFLTEQGYTVLINHVSRYAADVNRRPSGKNPRDARARAVYAETTFGKQLYDELLSPAETARRMALYHAPYHDALRTALEDKVRRFGRAVLLDLHSFGRDIAPDVVLGTGRGTTAGTGLITCVQEALAGEGFRAATDNPFTGGYITHRYGSRSGPVEAVQIELSYAAYIGPHALGEIAGPEPDAILFRAAQERLLRVFARLADVLR